MIFAGWISQLGVSPSWKQILPEGHEFRIDVVDPRKKVAARLYPLEDILGETLPSLLNSAEEKIRSHTKKEKAEVCGLICEAPQGDKFGVRLFTARSRSPALCLAYAPTDWCLGKT